MAERSLSLRERARDRGVPSLSEAVSATGGVAVALGILLITIDIRADQSGRGAEAGLFAALVLAGYLVLMLLPRETHPAGVSAVVLGIPGALGWALLPGAHSFADIRPFLILTIAAWLLAFAAPRTRGRTIFVAASALLLWLWILGEVVGPGGYSAAPLPSPPAHTLFSLESFVGARAAVQFTDLDSSSPLFPLAQDCNDGNGAACDSLYASAAPGSDFQQFAATCGNTRPNTDAAGSCDLTGVSPPALSPIPNINPIMPLTGGTNDKSLDIGLVSALFGIGYLGALFVFDRGGSRGLATAFVVPGFVALVTGTQSLGNAAHHAWVGGVLTFVAGIGIGLVGDRTRRRFTTWAGGVTVAYGSIVVALDAAHISRSVSNGNVKLAGPGMIVASFGVALVATAFVIAHLLGGRPTRGPGSESPTAPPFDAPAPSASPWGAPATPEPPPAPPAWSAPPPENPPAAAPPWGAPPSEPGPSWPPQP